MGFNKWERAEELEKMIFCFRQLEMQLRDME
jgi:hypothetical protein